MTGDELIRGIAERAAPNFYGGIYLRDRIAEAFAPFGKLLDAAREILELYPQTYRCEYGTPERVHIEVADWQEIKPKLEAAIRACEAARGTEE